MRVSIVATSLDGQQPETKSVINMVHRIQNRNPGYSDFGTTAGTTSFNFQNTNSNPISDGATALKLENEIVSEGIQSQSVDEVNNQYHEELLKNQEAESIVDNVSDQNEKSFSKEEEPIGIYSCHQAIRRIAFFESGGFNPENTKGTWIGDGETGLVKKLESNGFKIFEEGLHNENHFGYLFNHIVRGAGYSGNVPGYAGWDESAYFCCTK